jgi:MFS transporter, Spinster family, sphingosine-1-phosphate transporter
MRNASNKSSRGSRNWALVILFTVGALNVFDRQVVNILAQDIKRDFSLSDAQLGLLTGTAFGFFYSLLGIPLGRLADRVDRIKLIAVTLLLWSGFTALCAGAGSFVQLFLMRMGVGVGEAGAQPASTALIADYFPEGRRTLAMSILLVGVPTGSFLGLLVGGYVGSRWGWKTAFVVAGIPGIVLAMIMAVTLRDPRRILGPAGSRRVVTVVDSFKLLVCRRRFVWLTVGMICSSFFVYSSGAWLPAYFIRVYGMTTRQIGGYSAVAVGGGGGLGTLIGGLICDRLRRRVREIELKLLIIALGTSVCALLVIVLCSNRSLALASMIVLNFCAYTWPGPLVALIQQEATPDSRGLAVAISISISTILDLGLGLPIVGRLSDWLTPSYAAHAVGYAFALSGLIVGSIGIAAHGRALKAGRDVVESHFP